MYFIILRNIQFLRYFVPAILFKIQYFCYFLFSLQTIADIKLLNGNIVLQNSLIMFRGSCVQQLVLAHKFFTMNVKVFSI